MQILGLLGTYFDAVVVEVGSGHTVVLILANQEITQPLKCPVLTKNFNVQRIVRV